jgi:ATP-dependent helicase/DNAse subunit B
MREMIAETGLEMTNDTYFRLLRQMTDLIKIPFEGEPVSGLQVMGALETRALDFDNIILLSVNEGVFPSRSMSNSFVPYHLRRGFGLPTTEHQDAVWAYYFYRMIQRASRVIMLYDTRADGIHSGEVSRYVQQLRYHYHVPILSKIAVYTVASSRNEAVEIIKDEAVMRELSAFSLGASTSSPMSDEVVRKMLSASSINTYLDCPLRFYLTYVKGLREEAEVTDSMEHDVFGTIFHKVMELVYDRMCNGTVTADMLRLAAEDRHLTPKVEKAFATEFFHREEVRRLTGRSYLYGETVRKFADRILEYDRHLTPFVYISSERQYTTQIELADGRKVMLKCVIDRVDSVNGRVRIVDYKSGRSMPMTFASTDDLFDAGLRDRRKAVMQVFLYSWVYASGTGNRCLQPAVYYTRDIFGNPKFSPYIVNSSEKTVVEDFGLYYEPFETSLRRCMEEIFDPQTPVTQTTNLDHCRYCAFTGICGR